MPIDMPDSNGLDESRRPPIDRHLRKALDLRVDTVIRPDEIPDVKIVRPTPQVEASQPPIDESEVDEILKRHGVRPVGEGEVIRRDDLAA